MASIKPIIRSSREACSFELCAAGAGVSCAACCGLFNFAGHSRKSLQKILEQRTQGLAETIGAKIHTLDAQQRATLLRQKLPRIKSWTGRRKAQEADGILFSTIRVCPIVGFLDDRNETVGCMIHPAGTGGIDLRDLGVYDAGLCHEFKCPSYNWLGCRESEMIRRSVSDWYIYTLVITDAEFVKKVFEGLRDQLGRMLRVDDLQGQQAVQALNAIWRLKETWPFRDTSGRCFGAFVFPADDPDTYQFKEIDYRSLGRRNRSKYHRLLLCLGSEFNSGDELSKAESALESYFGEVASAVTSTAPAREAAGQK